MAEDKTQQQQQIRPRVRKGARQAPRVSTEKHHDTTNDNDDQVEKARKRMEGWMGLGKSTNRPSISEVEPSLSVGVEVATSDIVVGGKSAPKTSAPAFVASASSAHATQSQKGKPAKSILKTPKYTTTISKAPQVNAQADSADPAAKPSTGETNSQVVIDKSSTNNAVAEVPRNLNLPPSICKDIIVERDPTKPIPKRKIKARSSDHSHLAVEGYVSSTAGSPIVPVAASAPNAGGTHSSEYAHAVDKSPTVVKDGATTNSIDILPASAQNVDTSSEDGSAPLILNNLEELFKAAGQPLPLQSHDPNKITADAQLVEADIAFSVLTNEQFQGKLPELKRQHEEERQAQLRIFLGTDNIFEEDDDEHHEDGDPDAEDEDDDELLEMFMEDGMEDPDGNVEKVYDSDDDREQEEKNPRAFRLIWEALAEWTTPDAVSYISYLSTITSTSATTTDDVSPVWVSPVIERSDVEASRCSGLMAMIKLYLPKCLNELGYPPETRRTADTRLGELLRTFNYTCEAPKLAVKTWKAMTCILLDIVMATHAKHKGMEHESAPTQSLPPSVVAIEMTGDEYRYLTTSALSTFV